ncbi:hypothetical protein, unlikely [Trypanosoma congolense IL3000]|uniref:Uncharacterized protein n=1 Tax=Trypanosoma congolense (strain IL3000) TaxID=1068625 RepID=F9W5F5_TRYCI|nr:hypothetical protein, unlikely [Trypanosoma congolense IL3000]
MTDPALLPSTTQYTSIQVFVSAAFSGISGWSSTTSTDAASVDAERKWTSQGSTLLGMWLLTSRHFSSTHSLHYLPTLSLVTVLAWSFSSLIPHTLGSFCPALLVPTSTFGCTPPIGITFFAEIEMFLGIASFRA